MAQPTNHQRISLTGLVTGLLLGSVGFAAAWLAQGFDDQSRGFPLVVATLLAISGIAITAQAMIGNVELPKPRGGSLSVAAAVIAIGAWAAAFGGGLGFLLPTFLLQGLLLWLAGLRRIVLVLGLAAVITALAQLMFINLLDVPLPASSLPNPFEAF